METETLTTQPTLQAIAKPRDHEDGVARCAELLRRAVLTHDALPGDVIPSATIWPQVVRDAEEAYGYDSARPPKFTPTPRDVSNMLPVLDWLTWLGNENNGGRDVKVILKRARRVPWWSLAERFGRNDRTIRRWYDGAVAAIYGRFQATVWEIEPGP